VQAFTSDSNLTAPDGIPVPYWYSPSTPNTSCCCASHMVPVAILSGMSNSATGRVSPGELGLGTGWNSGCVHMSIMDGGTAPLDQCITHCCQALAPPGALKLALMCEGRVPVRPGADAAFKL
jgi:hypothetical protein